MTDRVRNLTIVLDKDYRTGDLESIINAIRMVKGVDTVSYGIVTSEDVIKRSVLKSDTHIKLHNIFTAVFSDSIITIDGKAI